MKVKIALLEVDSVYLTRITRAFNTKYPDKFVVYSFTEQAMAMEAVSKERIDVLLASDAFDIDVKALPKRCGFAYLVDAPAVETVKGQPAICKFQKIDLIYKQILSVYAEKSEVVAGTGSDDGSTRVILFTAPCGGVGTSCLAASCAMYMAAHGRKTLYLNLEKMGSADCFFTGEGQFNMSDLIFALKSHKANLTLKLESGLKTDPSGVGFYSGANIALDMEELAGEEKLQLLSELKIAGSFDVIVVDTDFDLGKEGLALMAAAGNVIWVSDGGEIANAKLSRALKSLAVLDERSDQPVMPKLAAIYNRFSSTGGRLLDESEIRCLGGTPKYEHATVQQVLGQLSKMDALFSTLM